MRFTQSENSDTGFPRPAHDMNPSVSAGRPLLVCSPVCLYGLFRDALLTSPCDKERRLAAFRVERCGGKEKVLPPTHEYGNLPSHKNLATPYFRCAPGLRFRWPH